MLRKGKEWGKNEQEKEKLKKELELDQQRLKQQQLDDSYSQLIKNHRNNLDNSKSNEHTASHLQILPPSPAFIPEATESSNKYMNHNHQEHYGEQPYIIHHYNDTTPPPSSQFAPPSSPPPPLPPASTIQTTTATVPTYAPPAGPPPS
jgi:hypothetical protein